VPRSAARTEEVGPFTLFAAEAVPWPYYARPRLGEAGAISPADVARARERQRELGVAEAFEWLHETMPERDVVASGLSHEQLGTRRARTLRGLTITAVAVDADGPLAVGSHQPVGDVTEIVGVGTLPVARRRGLGAAVTSRLVDDAHGRGVEIVFLSAGSEDIARAYARLGFRRIGTACIAEPAGG
jgi:GNAT superfamily N-acetyltransferase